METNERIYLTTAPVKKLIMKFAIPCILAMLVSALYNIVDQIFIGNSAAGTAGIMATTMVYPITVVALAIAQLLGDGCASLFSLSLGSKDEKTANKSVGNAIVAVVLASIVLLAVGFLAEKPILSLLGVNGYDARCQLFTKQYYRIILCGLPFYMFASCAASIIRASGAPGYSMVATLIGAVINLILDPILIFACDMGIQGAAAATIIGQFVSCAVSVYYFRKPKLMHLRKESFKIEGSVLGRLSKLGLSSFITQFSIAVISVVANNVIGHIGGVNATDAGGALGIVFKIFAIVLAFSLGVSVGAQPIIGFNYGAKKNKRVLEAYKVVLIANIIIGLVSMALFEFAPGAIVKMFGGNANDPVFYQAFAKRAFRVYLGGIALCCIQKSSCIFLQSINKPYKAMILSLARDVIILVPGVCLLGLLSKNLNTMLLAGPVADIGSFIITVIFVLYECTRIKKGLALEGTINEEVSLNFEENSSTMIDNSQTNKKHLVISIGREFGSGGKYIGQELAKRFNIKCYDKELVEKVSEEYKIDIETLESLDEKQKSSFWYSFAISAIGSKNGLSAEDDLFLKQAKVIEELASVEDCVIIGRCSDYIVSDAIKVFIYSSNEKFKIERKKEFAGLTEHEAIKKMNEIDKKRSEYYKKFTDKVWGDKSNYDLCIDSSVLGVEKTISLIEQYIKERI